MTELPRATQAEHRKIRIGDAAVDGLFHGIFGGTIMALSLVLGGLTIGEGPGIMMTRFDPAVQSALLGTLIHLAVSGVYGLIFGVGWTLLSRWFRIRHVSWLGGTLYGVLLLVIAVLVVLPGSNSALNEISLVLFTLAHILYGLTLGLLAGQTTNL